jgi:hypothetical protein
MTRLAGIAIALALLVPASAAAQTELPVGEAHGVRLLSRHGGIVLVFTHRADKLFKRIAGKEIDISCTTLEPDEDGFTSSGGGNVEVPLHRRRFATGDDSHGVDYCRLFLPRRTIKHRHFIEERGRRLLVSISLTQKGAVYLDEEKKALAMSFNVGFTLYAVKKHLKLSGWPTYEQVVQTYPQTAKFLVKLATPGDTPPPKKFGYYSDGKEHQAVVTLSTLGRRLFIETDADEVLRTNVSKYLFSEID